MKDWQVKLGGMQTKAKVMAEESLGRLAELSDSHSCEVAAERSYHRGRLDTLRELGLVDS